MTKVFKYVLKYKGTLIWGTISMLIVIGVDLLIPYMQQIFIDEGIIAGNKNTIIFVLGAILSISIIKAIFGYNKEFKYDLLSTWVHQDIKNDLFTHIQKLEFKYFDEMNTGELMSRIGEDAENIWQTIGYGLRLFVENIIYFVISTIILFYLNWKLALACFIVMIPIGFIAVQLEKKFGKCYGEISDKTAEINTTAQEDIAGIRLVKAFSREKYEISKFLKLNKSYYDLNMDQAKVIGDYFPKIEFLTNISLVLMIVFGGYLVMNGEMSIGVLVAFSGYIWNLIWPMRMLGELTDLISRNLASAKKIFAIIEREPEIKSGALEDVNIKGDIKFENVSFSYNDELVLKNINLDIESKKVTALIGPSGCGKSTFLRTLNRMNDLIEGVKINGQILIDGKDIYKEYDEIDLRKKVGMVFQKPNPFPMSIYDNIAYGPRIHGIKDKKKLDEIVETSLRGAALFDEVKDRLKKSALGLSGGQQQRLCIARTIAVSPEIILMDEPTSALDPISTNKMEELMDQLKKQYTVVIVTHNMQQAGRIADKTAFFLSGEVIEYGKTEDIFYRPKDKRTEDYITGRFG